MDKNSEKSIQLKIEEMMDNGNGNKPIVEYLASEYHRRTGWFRKEVFTIFADQAKGRGATPLDIKNFRDLYGADIKKYNER